MLVEGLKGPLDVTIPGVPVLIEPLDHEIRPGVFISNKGIVRRRRFAVGLYQRGRIGQGTQQGVDVGEEIALGPERMEEAGDQAGKF